MSAESLPQTDPPVTTLFTCDECQKASPGPAGAGAVNAPAHHRNGGGLDLSAACAEAPAGKHVVSCLKNTVCEGGCHASFESDAATRCDLKKNVPVLAVLAVAVFGEKKKLRSFLRGLNDQDTQPVQ